VKWAFNGKEITNLTVDESVYGFTYKITYTDSSYYYGMKVFWNKIKLKPRKTDRKNAKRIKFRESKWRDYESSSKDIGDRVIAFKEILGIYNTKRELSYREAELLVKKDVLFDNKCLNRNISGKWYKWLSGDVKEN